MKPKHTNTETMTELDRDCPKCLVEYVDFISNLNGGIGSMYGMDSMRRNLHVAMAGYYGLSEEETSFVCELDTAIRFCHGDVNAVCNGLHHRLSKLRNERVVEQND